ncbi:unnamed protein product [Ectocarpus sp. 12 AP-2014]
MALAPIFLEVFASIRREAADAISCGPKKKKRNLAVMSAHKPAGPPQQIKFYTIQPSPLLPDRPEQTRLLLLPCVVFCVLVCCRAGLRLAHGSKMFHGRGLQSIQQYYYNIGYPLKE